MIVALIPCKDEPEIEDFTDAVHEYVEVVQVASGGSLGEDLHRGLRTASLAGAARVVTIDAGWSHQPRDIPRLVAADADVVIGSRFCLGGHHAGPWWRSWASQAYSRACSWTTGYQVADWTSGYRVYSPAAVRVITAHQLVSKRHACQAEFLQVCLDAGLTVAEVPIQYRVMPGSTMNRAAALEAWRFWWSLATAPLA